MENILQHTIPSTQVLIERGIPFLHFTCECGWELIERFKGAGVIICKHCGRKAIIVQESVKLGKYYRRKSLAELRRIAKQLA